MAETASTEHAVAELDADGIAMGTIRNAKVLNIVGTPVIKDVTAAIDALAVRPEVRVLVPRGTDDRAFIGGADINEMSTLDRRSAATFIDGLRGMCEAVRNFPAPVMARIPGWCLGAGLEMAARSASNRVRWL
ncbi:enoyl-CoA hydratase-related protein [Saccharopolyspora sp. NPDC000995]